MNNIAEVRCGLVAVSRDCFPLELSQKRHERLYDECKKAGLIIEKIDPVVVTEKDVLKVLETLNQKNINALVIYLGNFGHETPTTMLAQRFFGPVMFAAAAEETGDNLVNGRGDAYCGMLNASYNIGLRKLRPYIPQYPAGTADEIAVMIKDFLPVARVYISVKKLKIFSFGPRPQDFLACNAPIKPLYDLGVEIMENSELDLYDICMSAQNDKRIDEVAADMAKELGGGNTYPDMLKKLAQYEVALLNFMEENLGASEYGIFANKCWPSFEKYFGFVPCYVNSRLASRGIPVACETDIYGALSEYIAAAATDYPVTLLDINNTVPPDLYAAEKKNIGDYKLTDLFMGFHCGNTPSCCLVNPNMQYQLIMHRLMEAGKDPDITRGTLEGQIAPSKITLFRLQTTADTQLRAYMAEGEVLNVNPKSFGAIGVFGIKNMARFYRHVLIEKRFPHHSGIAFKHAGQTLFEALKLLGVGDISTNIPGKDLYPGENPYSLIR
ncbi:MAG: fucose isomerase [Spirochaetales bacterium]|nr:fucose isomerase [Spirochaetales bacterium]